MASKAKDSLARYRQKAANAVKTREHTLAAVGTAFGMGWAEKTNEDTGKPNLELPAPEGIDPKALYGIGALVVATVAKQKRVKAFAQSMADGLLSVAAFQLGKEGAESLMPGDE